MQPRVQLGRTHSVGALAVKILLLGCVAGTAIAFVPALASAGEWGLLAAVLIGAGGIFAVYTTKRAIPAKYLLPGTAFLALFLVVPIVLTVQLATTNYGDGARTSKQETIQTLLSQSVAQRADSATYTSTVLTSGSPGSGPFVVFLVDTRTGEVFRGDSGGLHPAGAGGVTVTGDRVTAVEG